MKLSAINIYPIKSLGGIALNEAIIEERGLQLDRRRMLTDENGTFLTQREFPQMATLKVALTDVGLRVSNQKNDELFVPFVPERAEKVRVSVWSSKVSAVAYDETINEWFSANLGKKCRLVFMPNESRRTVNPLYAVRKYEDVVSFADGYPILLLGESSLDNLNKKLAKPLPMNRFRPNFEIRDAPDFAEDKWKKIKIGATVFHLVKPCERCVITTVDQDKGEFDGKEPLKTLATFRLKKNAKGQKILFGENLIAENFGETVRVGDEVEVLE